MPKPASSPISDAPELCRLSSAELTEAYAARRLSPVEVTRAALARAEEVQGRFNAFTRLEAESALASAAEAERRWQAGTPLSPIDGVPGTLKNLVATQGWPLTHGSTLLDDTPATEDAPCVARLRAAGMVFIGQTTMPEFGWKAVTDSARDGVTLNPWDPALTPGGSSGGAAVAAATGAGVLHLGTDGGGSIRIPAAFTGTSGIKPTFGRVPAAPPSPYGTMAHIGPMARRVEDVEAMLAALSGRDRRDWYQGEGVLPPLDPVTARPETLRIGVWSAPPRGAVDPEVAASSSTASARLAAAGAVVEEVTLPMADELYDIATCLWFSGARVRLESFGPLEDLPRDRLDPGLLAVAEQAGGWSTSDYIRAMGRRAAFGSQMDRLMEDYDLLIAPGCAVLPFAAGQEVPPDSGLARWYDWAGFSYPINLSQQPAAVVPAGLSEAGLPLSLQIIGARGADADVLALARWWQDLDPAHCP